MQEPAIPQSSLGLRIRTAMERARAGLRRHLLGWAIGGGVALALLLAVLLCPLGLLKPHVERSLGAALGAPVTIGELARRDYFTFSPVIELRDVRARQPAWAGRGDVLRADVLAVRVPLLPALVGRGLHPTRIEAQGLALALVRDRKGRANWKGEGPRKASDESDARGLEHLILRDGRFTLRDDKRGLTLAGRLHADEAGLLVEGTGRFRGGDATLRLTGPAIAGRDSGAAWPFELRFDADHLQLTASGKMAGALNAGNMEMAIAAKAQDLKYLDYVIEAGLFGTQPINLKARVRHASPDWFISSIGGTIGRSRFTGEAEVLKRDGRSKIEASVDFAQLDFDDLASDEGLAQARALRARIGPRVIPNTRISLAKVGPTDGVIHFRARRLLFREPSVFRTIAGDIRLDGKTLALDNVRADLVSGVMTGGMTVRQQADGAHLSLDLRFQDGSLGQLLHASDTLDAAFRARIMLSGVGDTIRQALSRADGHVALVAQDGHVRRVVATVLGQDLGKTIGAALDGKDQTVPMRCAAVRFAGQGGVLRATALAVETEISLANGQGAINLADESIALALGGISREASGLPLVDPVRIGGTLSQPALDIAGSKDGGLSAGSAIRAFGKSLGAALGLVDKKGPPVTRAAVGCDGTGVDLLD